MSRELRSPVLVSFAGDGIAGTGGVRALRFAASVRGKRGGVRAVCFCGGSQHTVYALLACVSSAGTDLNPAERCAVAAIVAAIRRSAKERR